MESGEKTGLTFSVLKPELKGMMLMLNTPRLTQGLVTVIESVRLPSWLCIQKQNWC